MQKVDNMLRKIVVGTAKSYPECPKSVAILAQARLSRN